MIEDISTITRMKDVTFTGFYSTERVNAVANIADDRLIINGIPEIVIMRGNQKFGSELQIKVMARAGNVKVEKRDTISKDKYDRIEINIPLEEGLRLLKAFSDRYLA